MTEPDHNELERRLRDAAQARMASIPALDEEAALSQINDRLQRGRGRRPWVLASAAAAVLVIAAVAIIVTRNDDKTTVATPPTESSSTSTASSSPGPQKPTAPQFAGLPVWPYGATYDDASAAAVAFATDYLGMSQPSAQANGDAVSIRPNGNGPTTVVHTTRTSNGYVVTGAHSDQMVIDGLSDGDAAPTTLSGKSTAFEATIVIEVRPFGSLQPTELVTAMGGANGEIGPFQAALTAKGPGVIVAYEPDASGRGAMTNATVIRVSSSIVPDQSAFDGTITGTNSAGQHVNVTAGAAPPAGSAPQLSTALGDLVAGTDGTAVSITSTGGSATTIGLGSNPTFRSPRDLAFVDANGITVWNVDVFTGKAEPLFTATKKITSLDGNVVGGLVFTDELTGLWRWDGKDLSPHGPVKMTDGYISAAW